MAKTLSELAARTGTTVVGDGGVVVARVATLESAGPDAVTFIVQRKHRERLHVTRAGAVIVPVELTGETKLPKLVSRDPYVTYARVAAILHPPVVAAAGVHPTAVLGARAQVAGSATVGAHAVLGDDVVVGERAVIGAGVVLGNRASVGADALLHPNATVYAECVIGPRSIVHAGAVIGADGFGMAEEGGRWLKIPQIGRVVVGADVEIGANTTIDRGALDDTIIEDDVKLDNQIQIGHNCRIGAHTAIAGCVGIAGSTRIGRNCKIGGAAMIAGHIDICDGVVLLAASSVGQSITVPGVYAGGMPALPRNEWLRLVPNYLHLTALVKRVRALEKAAGIGGPETTPPGGEET